LVSKEFCKALRENLETFEGVREVIIFSSQGIVHAHNIKAFAVKKAVLIFLFHHINELLARSANQLTPMWFVGRSAGVKLMVSFLYEDTFVAVTGETHLDEGRLKAYLKSCSGV